MKTVKRTYRMSTESYLRGLISIHLTREGICFTLEKLSEQDAERKMLVPFDDLSNMVNFLYELIDYSRWKDNRNNIMSHMNNVYNVQIESFNYIPNPINPKDSQVVMTIGEKETIRTLRFSTSVLKEIYSDLLYSYFTIKDHIDTISCI